MTMTARGHREVSQSIVPCPHQSPLGFDERPVLAVHLVVEATSVAEIVTIAVPSPQRSGGRATVHTLATLCK